MISLDLRRWRLALAAAAPAALLLLTYVAPPTTAAAAPRGAPRAEVERAARTAWLGLPSAPNGCPNWFDFFPKGGLANFYCHAQSLVTLERLEVLAGMSSRRPEGATSDALRAAFRQYDPRFVHWLRGALLRGRTDARFRSETQPVYDRYVAPLARKWLAARRLMLARREWMEAEVRWTREQIEAGTLPSRYHYARYAGFERPARSADGKIQALGPSAQDGNVGTNAVAYWIRRELDGSAEAFTIALQELVSTYDAGWLRDGAGLVRAETAPPSRFDGPFADATAAREPAAPDSAPPPPFSPPPLPPPAPRLSPSGPRPPAEAVVAEGLGFRITVADFEERMAEQSPSVRARYETLERKREFLDNLVRFQLLLAEAKRRGLDRDPQVIATTEKVMVQRLVQQSFQSDVESGAPPDEAELRDFYERNRGDYERPAKYRLQLHRLPRDRKAAERYRARLASGAPPSDVGGEADEPVDTGFLTREELSARHGEAIARAAATLAQGQLSAVIEARDGLAAVQLTARQEALHRTFDQVREQLAAKLQREGRTKEFDARVNQLRSEARVRVHDTVLDRIEVR